MNTYLVHIYFAWYPGPVRGGGQWLHEPDPPGGPRGPGAPGGPEQL